jgi:ketosteroid isomerase-like protein
LPAARAGCSLVGLSVDIVRSAFEALGDGDVEPLVALIDPAMEWRGRRRWPLFWQEPPS